jgi:hypothetical protein
MTVQTTPLVAANGIIDGRHSGNPDLDGIRGRFSAWPFTAPPAAAAFCALPMRLRRRERECGRRIRNSAHPRARAWIGVGMLTGRARKRACGLMLAVVALTLCGCGGGFALPGTTTTSQPQPQTYTITIAGTSGSLQHSTSVQITLQ